MKILQITKWAYKDGVKKERRQDCNVTVVCCRMSDRITLQA